MWYHGYHVTTREGMNDDFVQQPTYEWTVTRDGKWLSNRGGYATRDEAERAGRYWVDLTRGSASLSDDD